MPHIIYLDSSETPEGLLDSLRLTESGNPISDFPTHLSVPEICLGINHLIRPAADIYFAPLFIVAGGVRCQDLPALARAQTAAHRSIISYALISPDFPPSTDQWPSAPVTVYLPQDQEPGKSISLRGFRIQHFTNSPDLANQIIDQAISAQ
jgi:hypothetical protein